MVFPVVEQHVFGGLAGVAEAGSQVETENFAIHCAGAVGPVPFIVERPHAAPPVQQAESAVSENVFLSSAYRPAAGRHAVDLVVIIERCFVFIKGDMDDQRIGVFALQRDVRFKIRRGKRKVTRVALHLKAQVHAAFVVAYIAVLLGVFRQMQAAEGQGEQLADIGDDFTRFEVEQHHRYLARIRGMAICKLETLFAVGHLIEVPFLDAVERGFDICAAVSTNGPFRIAGRDDAVFVQHGAGRGDVAFLHAYSSPGRTRFAAPPQKRIFKELIYKQYSTHPPMRRNKFVGGYLCCFARVPCAGTYTKKGARFARAP